MLQEFKNVTCFWDTRLVPKSHELAHLYKISLTVILNVYKYMHKKNIRTLYIYMRKWEIYRNFTVTTIQDFSNATGNMLLNRELMP